MKIIERERHVNGENKMNLEELKKCYDKLQLKYGAKEVD